MKGFTLIELLVVVLIIGILSAVALPQYEKSVMKSRMAGAVSIARSIKDNLTIYFLENGIYPTAYEHDVIDFANKSCSGQTCRIGNYLTFQTNYCNGNGLDHSKCYPMVSVIYAPGSGYSPASSQTEFLGAGVYAIPATNYTPTLACMASGTKAQQICRAYSSSPDYNWNIPGYGKTYFYNM